MAAKKHAIIKFMISMHFLLKWVQIAAIQPAEDTTYKPQT